MAKEDILCPFTQRLCTECVLYRGRHYYLGSCSQYRGNLGKPGKSAKKGTDRPPVDFEALWEMVRPWSGAQARSAKKPEVKLKLIDMETGTATMCELEEARKWDWDNPHMMRLIAGLQVTNWDKLVEMVSFRAKRGYQEVEVYEAPRFLLLGGG